MNPDLSGVCLSVEKSDPFADDRGITFSTIRAAAGLEWRTVFLPNARDDIYLGKLAVDDAEGRERALRRFKLASTRAPLVKPRRTGPSPACRSRECGTPRPPADGPEDCPRGRSHGSRMNRRRPSNASLRAGKPGEYPSGLAARTPMRKTRLNS